MTSVHHGGTRSAIMAWLASAAAVVLLASMLALASRRFGYDTEVIDMPVLAVASGLVVAGLAFAIALPRLIAASIGLGERDTRIVLAIIIACGLAARLVLFVSEPVLEDDYQRYLWDGAVSASGANPYTLSPRQVLDAGASGGLSQLAKDAGPVLRRINHPELTTIYPAAAQGAFALAHVLGPWSLTAWRAVLLACELATLTLLLMLLNHTARSPLWVGLYWWNPLVIKEVANSAHMDAIVVAFVMLALVLAVTQRTRLAVAALGLAAAAKLWPVLLLPLILRPLVGDNRRLAAAIAIFAALLVLAAAPMIAASPGAHSGLAAYAQTWSTNSALFPLLEGAASAVLTGLGLPGVTAGIIARALIALSLGVVAVALAIAKIDTPRDLITRAGVVVAALVLLSPAQYPWYALWLAPFLVLTPYPAFLLMMATLPLYYASFHFAARETLEAARPVILTLIWVPVWTALAFEIWRANGLQARPPAALSN